MKRQTLPGIQISGLCLMVLLVTASIGCSEYKPAGPADEATEGQATEKGGAPKKPPKNEEDRGA